MADKWEAYFDFLGSLGDVLDELTGIAGEKLKAVRLDDLMWVNECMKREQALGLKLRSMDKKREQLLSELGLSGVPLSGLTAACPPEVRPQARDAAERLRGRYERYRATADKARNILETCLQEIERLAAERMPPECH